MWSCSSPPLAVRTQARTRPAYGRKVGVIICSVPVVGIGIGVPDPTGWMYTLYIGLRRFFGAGLGAGGPICPPGGTPDQAPSQILPLHSGTPSGRPAGRPTHSP